MRGKGDGASVEHGIFEVLYESEQVCAAYCFVGEDSVQQVMSVLYLFLHLIMKVDVVLNEVMDAKIVFGLLIV